MNRRDLLKTGIFGMAGVGLGQDLSSGHHNVSNAGEKADYTLRIAPVAVELDRSHIISTIGYNGTAPGPVLRMREGKSVSVEVINDTDTPELLHWHGMLIPPEVDGTAEEGSPYIPHGGGSDFN